MPSACSRPYAGVSTAILIFTRTGHGGTDRVWFYDMKADTQPGRQRSLNAGERHSDIIARFHALDRAGRADRTVALRAERGGDRRQRL